MMCIEKILHVRKSLNNWNLEKKNARDYLLVVRTDILGNVFWLGECVAHRFCRWMEGLIGVGGQVDGYGGGGWWMVE